jgi:putative membrane protein
MAHHLSHVSDIRSPVCSSGNGSPRQAGKEDLMRSIVTAAMFGAAVLTLACNRTGAGDDNAGTDNVRIETHAGDTTTGTAGSSDTVSHGTDGDARQFAIQMSKHNAAEVEVGRLAQQKGVRADVKEYGAMLVRDHSAKLEKLKQATASHGVTLNMEPPDDSEDLMEKLQGLSGAEFDREFMSAMVDAHQNMRAMVQGRLDDAKRMTTSKSQLETAVDQWAQEALPGVETHLMKAQQINEVLRNRTNDTR